MAKHNPAFVVLLVVLPGAAPSVHASGYALIEQSASGMGNAFAGAAATAEDASTIFFNPAGMTYLPSNQVILAGHAIDTSSEFSNQGSRRSPLTGGLTTQGGNGGDIGGWTYLPNVYLAKSIHPRVMLGVGVNSPFGLKTEYDYGWVGRYQALTSDLKSLNINPSLAWKVNDWLSLGAGFSAMWLKADLSNAVDFGTLLKAPQALDGQVRLTGDDWGWGWNLGGIVQFNPSTRLGLSYRSQVNLTLEGNANFSRVPRPLAALFANGLIRANVSTPDSLSTSLFHQINEDWDVMADLTWTNWSVFQDLTVNRLSGNVLTSTPEHWSDTFRVSIGGNYHVNEKLKLRTGFAYDESPVSTAYRTARIPDSNRYWLSVGANYKLTDASSVDFGYTHVFFETAAINKTTDTSSAALKDTVRGSYDTHADIFSAQFTHTF